MEPHSLLKKQIYNVYPLDETAWNAMTTNWQEVSYSRKQLITKAGDTERYLYYVVDGVQRIYAEHHGKESTVIFSYPPSFSGVIDSLFGQTPSKYHLETLTKSTLLRIHYNDLKELMDLHSSVERWVRVAVIHALSGTLARQVELMSYSAEEKFTTLLRRSPHILNLVPHKYIANYIGVDPATFSKLLGSVKL